MTKIEPNDMILIAASRRAAKVLIAALLTKNSIEDLIFYRANIETA